MPDDVITDKCEIIENCLARIRQEYDGRPENLHKNITRQDSILLNLERACQAAIDLALRVIRMRQLGVPKESRDAFDLLEKASIVPGPLADRMKRMVGFRNVAVHAYRELDLDQVETVIQKHLSDFESLVAVALKL